MPRFFVGNLNDSKDNHLRVAYRKHLRDFLERNEADPGVNPLTSDFVEDLKFHIDVVEEHVGLHSDYSFGAGQIGYWENLVNCQNELAVRYPDIIPPEVAAIAKINFVGTFALAGRIGIFGRSIWKRIDPLLFENATFRDVAIKYEVELIENRQKHRDALRQGILKEAADDEAQHAAEAISEKFLSSNFITLSANPTVEDVAIYFRLPVEQVTEARNEVLAGHSDGEKLSPSAQAAVQINFPQLPSEYLEIEPVIRRALTRIERNIDARFPDFSTLDRKELFHVNFIKTDHGIETQVIPWLSDRRTTMADRIQMLYSVALGFMKWTGMDAELVRIHEKHGIKSGGPPIFANFPDQSSTYFHPMGLVASSVDKPLELAVMAIVHGLTHSIHAHSKDALDVMRTRENQGIMLFAGAAHVATTQVLGAYAEEVMGYPNYLQAESVQQLMLPVNELDKIANGFPDLERSIEADGKFPDEFVRAVYRAYFAQPSPRQLLNYGDHIEGLPSAPTFMMSEGDLASLMPFGRDPELIRQIKNGEIDWIEALPLLGVEWQKGRKTRLDLLCGHDALGLGEENELTGLMGAKKNPRKPPRNEQGPGEGGVPVRPVQGGPRSGPQSPSTPPPSSEEAAKDGSPSVLPPRGRNNDDGDGGEGQGSPPDGSSPPPQITPPPTPETGASSTIPAGRLADSLNQSDAHVDKAKDFLRSHPDRRASSADFVLQAPASNFDENQKRVGEIEPLTEFTQATWSAMRRKVVTAANQAATSAPQLPAIQRAILTKRNHFLGRGLGTRS
jgi:hypothetical protein